MHQIELEIIHFIHQFRNPLGDGFFKLMDFFDRPEFFFIIIPVLWLVKGWKTGFKFFCILMLSSIANYLLKEFFHSPRPFHLDPSVAVIQVKGYGFPSGAAQTAIILSCFIVRYWKNSWKWTLALSFFSLLSFSRVYLGVHFPTDILAGWFIGALLLGVYIYLFPLIEKKLKKQSPFSLFLLSQFVPALLLLLKFSPITIKICSIAMGMGVGLYISYHCQLFLDPPKGRNEILFRIIVGVAGTFICHALFLFLLGNDVLFALFLRGIFLGIFLSLGSHLICKLVYKSRVDA